MVQNFANSCYTRGARDAFIGVAAGAIIGVGITLVGYYIEERK